LEVPAAIAEDTGQLLIELGAGAVEERPGERGARLIVYGSDASELEALAEQARELLAQLGFDEESGNLSLRIEIETESDWDTAWTRHLQPQRLTPRWVVQPIGNEATAEPGTGRIWIRPVLAFGDGAHVTTRVAAQTVERFCQALPGASVLDIGTGTGVLAFVAALSGASRVVGVDLDPVALAAARENAELNQLGSRVHFEDASSELGSGFDLVVANLEPRTLLQEAARIGARAGSARALVVTGFLTEQAPDIAAAFAELGFGERERLEAEAYCLLVLARPEAFAP
jgi:ribosomal protein L11 methyltransferase